MTCKCGGNMTVKIDQERDEYEGVATCDQCGMERKASGDEVGEVYERLEAG